MTRGLPSMSTDGEGASTDGREAQPVTATVRAQRSAASRSDGRWSEVCSEEGRIVGLAGGSMEPPMRAVAPDRGCCRWYDRSAVSGCSEARRTH